MQQTVMCPIYKEPCKEEGCAWFVKSVKQTPPPECKPIQFNVCAIVMIPDMLVDIIKHTVGTQAAVEDSRNEMVQRQDISNQMQQVFLKLAAAKGRKAIASST